jgi:photosystem II stability/assembly factor-like uncharacterized protein
VRGPRTVVIRAALAILACALALRLADDGQARAADDPTWEHIGAGLGAFRDLWAPASGAFLANTASGAVRSDDGGLTWRPIAAPPELADRPVLIRDVHPRDHGAYYVAAEGGDLYRTGDDGATWSAIGTGDVGLRAGADSNLLYRMRDAYEGIGLARTSDGGATWESLKPPLFGADRTAGPGCTWRVNTFYAHPSDPSRAFFSGGCFTTKDNQSSMSYTTDLGATWSSGFSPAYAHPGKMAGGYDSAPDRLYLVTFHSQGPGSQLYRSDDRGETWEQVASFGDGRSATDLVVDPSDPDRLFVKHDVFKVSTDGGVTWQPFAGPPEGITRLVVGIDGKYVFASNQAGLHRLPQP